MSSESTPEHTYRTKASIWIGIGSGLMLVGPLLLIWSVWPSIYVKIGSMFVVGCINYLVCDKVGRYLTRRKFGRTD